jgi:transposase
MQRLLGISCGLDVHKDIIEACILVSRDQEEPEVIREGFTTLRGDLFRLRDWLLEHGCMNVAMESTGVFWIPAYEVLEEEPGMELCVVNARHMKAVPGRKTDVKDAEWISSLFMCGLLNKSYVPERGIRDLREYTRYYTKLVQERTRQVNRTEKFLQTHGFKLSSVLSSIDLVSSKRILEKLCKEGEVSAADVRLCLAGGVKSSAEEIAYAINGKLSETSQGLLRLLLDALYSIDAKLDATYKSMMLAAAPYESMINLLNSIPGISKLSAAYIIAEIGVDMSAFANTGKIVSWAGLRPGDNESAGVVKSSKITKGNKYVKSVLCQCAWAAVKTRGTRLSNWFWRNVKRLGEKKAIIAVARKLLCYVYCMLSTGELYDCSRDVADTERYNAFKLDSAKRQVAALDVKNKEADEKNKGDARKKSVNEQGLPLRSENIDGEQKSPILNPHDQIAEDAPKKRGRPKKQPAA